jgi:hypothetical protein
LFYVFLKPTRVNVGDNWNLPQTQNEMRNWTCFGWTKFKNSNSDICTISSSHFPSMINTIGPSLVAMELWRKPNLWTFDFEWQILQWTSPIEQMMTFATWQFPHFLDWRCSRASYGQYPGHLILMLKQETNEDVEKKRFVKNYNKKN